ncbi:hypothetical protein [Nostoc sp.]|uniref:hypothetical protein n=1 Tax=Nostoc sp. TaxID=1180 RepID=UPI002FFD56E6
MTRDWGLGTGDWGLGIGDWGLENSFYTNLKNDCDRWFHKTQTQKAIPNPKSKI